MNYSRALTITIFVVFALIIGLLLFFDIMVNICMRTCPSNNMTYVYAPYAYHCLCEEHLDWGRAYIIVNPFS